MNNLEFYTQYTNLYNWWFNPINQKYWFNSVESDDLEISNLFGDLLDPDTIEKTDVFELDYYQSIGFILAHDQISRHWVRSNKINRINEFLDAHYNIIKNFIMNFYSLNCNKINGHEFCFVLLPLRHTQDYDKIKFVLNETWKKLENNNLNEDLKQIYKKYLKATYERAKYNIISQINLDNTDEIKNKDMQTNVEYYINKYRKVLDMKCFNYTNDMQIITSRLIEKFKDCKNMDRTRNLIVSISGGVDSMVLAYILKNLGYNLVLVHINYSNRLDTELEQEFTIDWGKYLGVKIFYRILDEINRPKCMEYDLRNIYETYTRDQRYQAYIKTAEEMGWSTNYSIVLGHNHDDCIENVFTNIASKSKWENLYGMAWESTVEFKNNKLTFLRPFINVSKQDIYNYAQENKILFLWDSTPKWSQRGKIRDIVRPSLNEFNMELIPSLDTLVKTLQESIECVDQLVSVWIESSLNINSNKFIKIIPINKLIKTNIFWSKLLEKISIQISVKCLESLVLKLNQIENNFNLMQINKIEKFQLNKNLQIKFKKNEENNLVILI